LETAMNSLEVFADDAKEFSLSVVDTCNPNHDLTALNIASDEGATVRTFQHGACTPHEFRLTKEVCLHDEARQQTFGQDSIVVIFKSKTLVRRELIVEVRFFFRKQLGNQILLPLVVQGMAELKLSHQRQQVG